MRPGVEYEGMLRAWRDKAAAIAVVIAALVATSFALRPLERSAWAMLSKGRAGIDARSIEAAVGQGVVAGLLGGFRALAADFLWLKVNASWEDGDLPATQTIIRAVTAIDPRPLYFWINGARMIAYDMPNWRIDQAGGLDVVPPSVRERIDEEQARVALGLLDEALQAHPGNPVLAIEIANIHLRRLGDTATAAEFYRVAAESPGAPFYAARIHAELLRRLGRDHEAHAWLVRLHPTLPADVPEAMEGIVFARIRELEEKLGMPESERYVPPGW